jgi:hypothetical protein
MVATSTTDIVQNCHIEFDEDKEVDLNFVSHPTVFNENQSVIITDEIKKLVEKNVYVPFVFNFIADSKVSILK